MQTARLTRRSALAVAVAAVIAAGAVVAGCGEDTSPAPAAPDAPAARVTTPAAPATSAPATTTIEPSVSTTLVPPSTPETSAPTTTAAPISTTPTLDVAPGTFDFALIQPTNGLGQRGLMTVEQGAMTVTIETQVDSSGRIRSVTTASVPGSDMEMIMDLDGNLAYYRGAAFESMLTGNAEWVAMDLAKTLEASGQSLDGVRQNMLGAAVPAFSSVGIVPQPTGFVDVDGERTLQYDVEIDGDQLRQLIAANPQFVAEGAMTSMLESVDSVTYQLFVTEANTLRRLIGLMVVDGQSIMTTMDMFPLDPSVVVEIPPAELVQVVEVP